jgi:NAD(P)-dependent dehydrogenase (short-subunit alcohol dehydrogenase family)
MLSKGHNLIGLDLIEDYKISNNFQSQLLEFNIDIRKQDQITKFIDTIQNAAIEISGVIHFAAINPKSSQLEYSYILTEQKNEEIYQALQVGTLGAFAMISSIEHLMSENCSVVLIGSDLSLVAPNQQLYCECEILGFKHGTECRVKPLYYAIDKASTVALTKYLSTYFAAKSKNIRVNCICIGPVENDMNPKFIEKLASTIPLRRLAKVGEYNDTFEFMLINSPNYQTGSIVTIDGGKTII